MHLVGPKSPKALILDETNCLADLRLRSLLLMKPRADSFHSRDLALLAVVDVKVILLRAI